MNILIPDHISAEVRGRWATLDPAVSITPLTIVPREFPARRLARAAASRLLPYGAYAALGSALAPCPRYDFFIRGQKLTAPNPEIDCLLASWMMDRRCFLALRPLLPNLKWIHSSRTGVDHLTGPEANLAGVQLTCARGLHSERIAEFILGVIFAFAKRLLDHRDLQRAGQSEERSSRDVAGKRALMLGTGSIGVAAARRLLANGVRVEGLNSNGRGVEPFEKTHGVAELKTALAQADFVIVTLPLTASTRGLLDAPALAAAKPGALLVNISRDEIMDEPALLEALRAGKIKASMEGTRPGGFPRRHPFNTLPGALATHHSSWSGDGAEGDILGRFEENLRLHLRGEAMLGLVDPAKGY